MENVRELLNNLNKFSVIDASKRDKEVLLENDIKVTYRISNWTFYAVLHITLGKSEPITWDCIDEKENHEVVKWFELKEASIYKKKQAQIDRDTQILKSLIKL